MAKGTDFLSPKAVANRQKMKGLQKLKFYCQLCEKQCRDQNGFKQHCSSESHLRQVAVFGQNSGRFIRGYSEQFLSNFLDMMAVSHRNTRIKATVAYNEYIANKTTRAHRMRRNLDDADGICEIFRTGEVVRN